MHIKEPTPKDEIVSLENEHSKETVIEQAASDFVGIFFILQKVFSIFLFVELEIEFVLQISDACEFNSLH